MTVEEFNALVGDAYEAAFEYEDELVAVYLAAYERQTAIAAKRFESSTLTASWTPPELQSLTDGMSEEEVEMADEIRDEAALAVVAALSVGIRLSSREFLEAISLRAQTNFEQEVMRNLRKIVQTSFDSGLSAEATAQAIRERLPQVIPSSAQMLAQTELTALVNERTIVAAQAAFPDGASKTWLTVGDNRVRSAHAAAQGQTVPLDQPFQVGGASLMYPGDPSGPLRLVARCRCRLSYSNEQSAITAAARPDVSELAMIAVYPTTEEAEAISTAGGNPPDTMHVTMVFLGDVNEIDLAAAARAVERVAQSTSPLSGRVGGIGMFAGGPDGFPQLAIPNVQGLATLRTRLTNALDAEGIMSPSEHDWVPHMTLAYVEEPSLPEDMLVIGSDLTFNDLSLTVADVRTDFPFTAPVVASAQEDTLMSTMEETNEPTATAYVKILPDFSSWPTEIGLTTGSGTNMGTLKEGVHYTINAIEPFSTITISTDDTDNKPTYMEDGPSWRALLAVEGVATEDGRMLAEGCLTWRDLPLSLMAMDETTEGGHLGAKVAGRVDRIWRDETNTNEVWGEGVFNTDEFGAHIAELVGNQSLRGNSIDPAVTAYEYRDLETGEVLEGDGLMDAMMEERPILTVFLEAIIMASTVCSTPAIGAANIILASGLIRTSWYQEQINSLTASAAGMAPLHPPAAWFENPRFNELTPLTVTDDGRVMGHAAGWNTCHIGEPNGPGVCVTPPRSGMGYEVFHHGAVKTDEGHDVSVGHITMSTNHASGGSGWKAAQEHYDNSGSVVADVRAGEDRFGIWVSGALRPDLPAAKVREMKAGSISGDWRSVIGRGLEFISALIVNIPGFPIPRPQATIVASAAGVDEVESLVAAGIVECDCVDDMSRREYLRLIRSLTN